MHMRSLLSKFTKLLTPSYYLAIRRFIIKSVSVVNLSSYKLSDAEILLLSKGVSFSVPPQRLDKTNIITSFKLIYKQSSPGSINGLHRFKQKLKNMCYSYIYSFDAKEQSNLSNDELDAFHTLLQQRNLIISKPDKGNGVVVLDKTEYIHKMNNILNDQTKLKCLSSNPTESREKKLQRYLYGLSDKGLLDDATYKRIRPSGSNPARLYGLPKLHKDGVPVAPLFHA